MFHHSDRRNLYNRWKSIRGIKYAILAMVLLSQTAITIAQNPSLGKLASASGIDLQVLSTSIASDSSGNIYYVNTAQSTLYRVSKTGVQTELQCCGALGGGLAKPRGVAIDSQGNLYIADTGNNRIVKLDQYGNASAVSTGLFSLSRPAGVALDLNDDLYIADAGNNRVLEIAAAGGQAFVINTTGFILSNPSSVSIDKNNTLYIADTGNNRIVTVPASGSPSLLFGSQIQSPLSVTIDGNGNGFISQSATHVVPQGGSSGQGSIPSVVSSFSEMNMNVNAAAGGGITSVNVTLTPIGGFTGTVYLSVVGLPPNVIAQLTHPIAEFNVGTPVTESMQVGESVTGQQQSRLIFKKGRPGMLQKHGIGAMLACLLPFSLLSLSGFRANSKKLGRAYKYLGLVLLFLILPVIAMTTSGCANSYPAGLFGNSTYTATLVATPANGTPYSLGSFGVTIQN
jgi:sugar lactone lactonase YvrE